MLSVARDFALEGFILKRADSRYQPGRRSRDWIKYVCRQRTSVVVGGWIPSRNNPEAVATVLMGAHDSTGNLVYCGHVGVFGLTTRLRRCTVPRSAANCSSTRSVTVCMIISPYG